jgi:ArsR family transcriptional regulator
MNEREKMRCAGRAKIVKALAHPTRVFIVEKLNEKPHCVCELSEMIGADMSTVSRHLSLLKEAGVVTSEKSKQTVHYRLAAPCVIEFFNCLENVIRHTVEHEYAYLLEK